MTKNPIDVPGSTVPFFTYEEDGLTWLEFDSSECDCPEPMLNAMRALQRIDAPHKRLVMINMHEPAGLYPRIAEDFTWQVTEQEDGNVRIVFAPKSEAARTTDFNNTACGGV